jgi:hypothetical protein
VPKNALQFHDDADMDTAIVMCFDRKYVCIDCNESLYAVLKPTVTYNLQVERYLGANCGAFT